MSYVDENIKANEDKAQKMGGIILDEIDQFKYTHQINGYTNLEVNEFLDRLEKLVKYNMNTSPQNLDSKEKKFNHEYVQCGNTIIEGIKKVRFTQLFRGYDTAEVDRYLDDLIRLVKYHRDYNMRHNMIERTAVTNTAFTQSFRGYDPKAVDAYIKKVSFEMNKLNNIKRKFI